MIKTFNRVPASVPTPSSSDVKSYFFNQANWKGLCDDKNVLGVDQETFEDCNNVYIDAEGILRSRPALKNKIVSFVADGQTVTLTNIVDMWYFQGVTIYESLDNDTYYINFINTKANRNLREELKNDDETYSELRIFQNNDTIFLFTPYTILRYETNVGEDLTEATDYIYSPISEVVGFDGQTVDSQDLNFLTPSHRRSYLYSLADGYSSKLLGKNVYVELNDEKYNISKFTKITPYAFMKEHSELTELLDNLSDDLHITSSELTEPADTTVLLYDKENVKAYVSIGGEVFTELTLPALTNLADIKDVVVSKDGFYMFALTKDSVYIKNLIKTGETYKYPNWYPIFAKEDSAANHPGNNTNNPNYFASLGTGETIEFKNNDTIIAFDDTCYLIAQIKDVVGASNGTENDDTIEYKTVLLTYVSGTTTLYYNTCGKAYNANRVPSYAAGGSFDCFTADSEIDGTPIISFAFVGTRGAETDYVHGFVLYENTPYFQVLTISVLLYVDTGTSPYAYTRILNNSVYFLLLFKQDVLTLPSISLYKYTYVDPDTIDSFAQSFASPSQHPYTTAILLNETTVMTNTNVIDTTTGQIVPLANDFSNVYAISNYALGKTMSAFYYDYFSDVLDIIEEVDYDNGKPKIQPYLFDHLTFLVGYYMTKDNVLYISEKSENDTLYFPEKTKQVFDKNITNVHPISTTEVAVFFDDEIWYSTYDAENNVYRYTKSKLQVGCKNGSDVITTYDGKYTIFASKRGLVAMAYQDFIASSEQALTYLSDTIYGVFDKYLDAPIKLYQYGFWIVIYKQNSNKGFILDIRNNSWWPVEIPYEFTSIATPEDKPLVLSNGKVYTLDTSDLAYFDDIGIKHLKIAWHLKSQKLHMQAINNYKHIVNITFVSVHDEELIEQASFNENRILYKLQINNYRKTINGNIGDAKDYVCVEYEVNSARTFVQRLNYSKVNEFQYYLAYNVRNAIDIPLSLNSICIKYKIGGQVR